MKKIKIGAFVMAFFLIAALAAFAGGARSRQADSGGSKTTLKLWIDYGGEEELNYLKSYEQSHPNISLEISTFEAQDYKTQSRLALASGVKPDVWRTNTGTSLTQFVDSGGCLDITDYIGQYGWDKSFGEAMLDVGRRNGRLYALPHQGFYTWQALYANKQFFERTGIPYPKTVDDMINAAKQIRAAGIQPIAFGNKDGWPGQILLGDYMAQVAEVDFADKLNAGTYRWDNRPELKTAFEAIQKLAQGGAFVDGYATTSMDVGGTQTWVAQKAAFLYCGTWFYGPDIQEMLEFDVETIALPLVSANTRLKSIQTYPDPAIMVDGNTKFPKEAVDFLNHCTSQGWFEILVKKAKAMTPSAEANKKLQLPDWLKAEPIAVQVTLPQFNFWTAQFPLAVEESLANNIKMVMEGSISIDQALKNIEAEHARNR
ncbi:MAG: ABC transporter substrate-binding protein [Treponema sp.]|jgi:raffinose/stachyose/melibiose transport system substrate-binding protein|nr:ABC transporter substrate-binding protein [Treponema sp.]